MILEYDGSFFHGWQRQNELLTVQGVLEDALMYLTTCKTAVFAAGRTDCGVHAQGQVAHFLCDKPFTLDRLRRGTNFYLKKVPVRVLCVEEENTSFHARFSALRRHYCYKILNRPSASPLREKRVWWIPKPLDTESMQKAADLCVGHHNFAAFRATACQAKSSLKTMEKCDVVSVDDELHINLSARSFLHHQVRIMVGTFVKVGLGVWPLERIRQLLLHGKRQQSGPTAPSEGLYFLRVDYP